MLKIKERDHPGVVQTSHLVMETLVEDIQGVNVYDYAHALIKEEMMLQYFHGLVQVDSPSLENLFLAL